RPTSRPSVSSAASGAGIGLSRLSGHPSRTTETASSIGPRRVVCSAWGLLASPAGVSHPCLSRPRWRCAENRRCAFAPRDRDCPFLVQRREPSAQQHTPPRLDNPSNRIAGWAAFGELLTGLAGAFEADALLRGG